MHTGPLDQAVTAARATVSAHWPPLAAWPLFLRSGQVVGPASAGAGGAPTHIAPVLFDVAPAAEGAPLAALLAEIAACRLCAGEIGPHEPRPVVRVRPTTRLLICGQAPGRRVHESGLPFDDASGDRLRDWLGVARETFYHHPAIGVAAMAFCFPGTDPKGGDYPPPARCSQVWRPRLLAELPQVELTLLVGAHAQRWRLGRTGRSMTETVAGWRDLPPEVLPLPHPSWRNTAWLRRHPWFEAEVVPQLRARVAAMLEQPA